MSGSWALCVRVACSHPSIRSYALLHDAAAPSADEARCGLRYIVFSGIGASSCCLSVFACSAKFDCCRTRRPPMPMRLRVAAGHATCCLFWAQQCAGVFACALSSMCCCMAQQLQAADRQARCGLWVCGLRQDPSMASCIMLLHGVLVPSVDVGMYGLKAWILLLALAAAF